MTTESGSASPDRPSRVRYGYFLATEDHGPRELVEQARMAEDAGFEALWISDHYHPWVDAQGHSPFVWSVIGALSEATRLPVQTAVTCPTVRTHPAVIAQAVATAAVQLEGRFRFGVGSGEALNEHILGTHWPTTPVRLEMLEEAVGIIRELLTGEQLSHRGTHYTVQNARLYTVPEDTVPIDVSGFGPIATDLAARIGDGYISMGPEGDLLNRYRERGGTGPASSGVKACWDPDRDNAVRTVLRCWPNLFLPGEMASLLPDPRHFEQATQLITERHVEDGPVPCGPDAEAHIKALTASVDAGFDHVYVSQIGPDMRGFFDFYRDEVLPHLPR
ncbi:TIGR03557 family F420-dependent LLM class oxidoreductase [Streptomyces sp. ST2-7A]|uniref:TIGR03557 family F420-dependent LLM class oxidoreductase n=1 Tax=Streptomyces sp. ST2-7A TaxID=2907214 RepID=UPI001F1F1D2B|nr:TIGR03557 family F420-dependent LLM class oxidoreductase [Streptomyces sp. ST2-7A]MCE7080897.1 TIGR03557 family F420-dependent LLM class oxidoreductase [Streptomyces sp. ST2-7A]